MSDTKLTPEQMADLQTWDERARAKPWPFKSRFLTREEFLYLDMLRGERRIAAAQVAAERAAAAAERLR